MLNETRFNEIDLTRPEAIDRLQDLGIQYEQVYLIDLIPLIEMMWSDGALQHRELDVFQAYLEKHVSRMNALAGYSMLTIETAQAFIQRFLTDRPSTQLLETLRSLIPPIRMGSSEQEDNERLRSSLLQVCLDIATSSTIADGVAPSHATDALEQFCALEKQCWFEIFDTLHGTEHGTFSAQPSVSGIPM
jgi:hypothetical protein